MRFWQFGVFSSQQADIDGLFSRGGKSILSFQYNINNVESSQDNWNPLGSSSDAVLGQATGGDPGNYFALVSIALGQIKAKLGQIPVLIKCDLSMECENTDTMTMRVYRMYSAWDGADTTSRYKDKSALTPWYEDTYGPYPGQDRSSTPDYQGPTQEQHTAGERTLQDITSIVERALRDNTPILMMLWPHDNFAGMGWRWKHTDTTMWPFLDFYYVYPIEFYEDSGGSIDYSSTIQEAEDGHYYIGAVERGATGAATKGWIRNYSGATQQVELFDDHPEFTIPVQRAGTGTGQLDYMTLADNAVSQLLTPVFYSSTQYEVKAEAYRDNSTSLHPQIDADASWRGTVGADWTSPVGGFTIPAAAWQPGTLLDDEFEIGVRGNTTDSAWPADSNDQVEVTYDDAGSPDATAWRPMLGHREKSTASVDVDGTTIFFPMRYMVPAEWPVGDPCFIMDADNIDEGTISSVQERSLADEAFTGSGLDDCDITGNFNGNADHDYRVVIDATGTPDTFSWSRTGDATYIETGVACSATPYHLENGVYVEFAATTGHTAADRWDSAALTWGVTVGGLTGGAHSYAAGSAIGTTLPLRDLEAAVFATVDQASGASETPASRVYLDDTNGFTQADVIFLQQVANLGIYESATIATGGVQTGYLDLTATLTNDYAEGDFCTKQGSGEEPFWMRPVATVSTVEELKRLRVNARML